MNTICPIWIRSSLSFISHQLLTWLMIHNLPKRIHSMVGLSTVRVGSGLGSTCIRPDLIGWSHHQLAADREDDRIKWVGASTNVRQIRWGWRFGKQRESSYMKNSWNLARKKNWKTAKIWQYLTKSSKISAIFDKILARSSEISPGSSLYLLENIPKFVESTISCWKNKWVGWFGLLGFVRRRFNIQLANLVFWKKKPLANC